MMRSSAVHIVLLLLALMSASTSSSLCRPTTIASIHQPKPTFAFLNPLAIRGGATKTKKKSARSSKSSSASSTTLNATPTSSVAAPIKVKRASGLKRFLSNSPLLSLILSPSLILTAIKGYFRSLIDPSYPTAHDAGVINGANLRNSLQGKAMKSGGSRSSRGIGGGGGTKQKRGQAKTLSDLPKLSK
jgi:hypothetical protein